MSSGFESTFTKILDGPRQDKRGRPPKRVVEEMRFPRHEPCNPVESGYQRARRPVLEGVREALRRERA
jgi:hypothetical protein